MDDATSDTTGPLSGSHASPPVASSTPLLDAMSEWRTYGLPHFVRMMSALHDEGIISDPIMKTVAFKIVGGYIYRLTEQFDGDFSIAHVTAVSSIMADPAVSALMERALAQSVDNAVEGLVG